MAAKKAQATRRSHTRAPARPRLTTAERVQTIIDMMVELRWRSGKSDKQLAAKWGWTPNAVRKLAAEASRAIKREMGDPEEWRARLIASVNLIGRRALAAKNYDAAIRSQVAVADMLGLKKTALEVSGPNGGPITLEQAAADRARVLEELAEFAAQISAGAGAQAPDAEPDQGTDVELAVPGEEEAAHTSG